MVQSRAFLGEGTPEPTDHDGNAPGLLGFHGFGATPRELDPLAEVAHELGLAVRVALFPGHGTHPDELAKTRFADWYGCGERELAAFRARFGQPEPKVVLAGLSTGALVAMRLAAEHPGQVAGLIVLANALTLTAPYPAWPLRLLHVLRAPNVSVPKSKGPDIADPEARARHLTYSSQPLLAAADLQHAGSRIRTLLPRIHCPVFIAHGQDDHVCPVSNAWTVANSVATNDKEVLILRRSWHIITKDYDQAELCERVRQFLQRVTAPRSDEGRERS